MGTTSEPELIGIDKVLQYLDSEISFDEFRVWADACCAAGRYASDDLSYDIARFAAKLSVDLAAHFVRAMEAGLKAG